MLFLFKVPVEDIEEMFSYADQDCDGKISWSEFQIMINPPKPPETPKPTLADLVKKNSAPKPQTLSVTKIISESISSNFEDTSWSTVVRGTPT